MAAFARSFLALASKVDAQICKHESNFSNFDSFFTRIQPGKKSSAGRLPFELEVPDSVTWMPLFKKFSSVWQW
ncbi:hypothetical protein AQUCO_00400017v1 [Aquilegia coerulea]|uniref:Uncharacterized protein n=1 Tax=Aquilegia coerulea TaxID=218851 RepID=A0A2G5ET58_AQUCA|nr:hypothetical protein AQUCO_00400017v1 [Aquilegia coerulea]